MAHRITVSGPDKQKLIDLTTQLVLEHSASHSGFTTLDAENKSKYNYSSTFEFNKKSSIGKVVKLLDNTVKWNYEYGKSSHGSAESDNKGGNDMSTSASKKKKKKSKDNLNSRLHVTGNENKKQTDESENPLKRRLHEIEHPPEENDNYGDDEHLPKRRTYYSELGKGGLNYKRKNRRGTYNEIVRTPSPSPPPPPPSPPQAEQKDNRGSEKDGGENGYLSDEPEEEYDGEREIVQEEASENPVIIPLEGSVPVKVLANRVDEHKTNILIKEVASKYKYDLSETDWEYYYPLHLIREDPATITSGPIFLEILGYIFRLIVDTSENRTRFYLYYENCNNAPVSVMNMTVSVIAASYKVPDHDDSLRSDDHPIECSPAIGGIKDATVSSQTPRHEHLGHWTFKNIALKRKKKLFYVIVKMD